METGGFQIGQGLSEMGVPDRAHGLQFDHDEIRDDHVQAVFPNELAFVENFDEYPSYF